MEFEKGDMVRIGRDADRKLYRPEAYCHPLEVVGKTGDFCEIVLRLPSGILMAADTRDLIKAFETKQEND